MAGKHFLSEWNVFPSSSFRLFLSRLKRTDGVFPFGHDAAGVDRPVVSQVLEFDAIVRVSYRALRLRKP